MSQHQNPMQMNWYRRSVNFNQILYIAMLVHLSMYDAVWKGHSFIDLPLLSLCWNHWRSAIHSIGILTVYCEVLVARALNANICLCGIVKRFTSINEYHFFLLQDTFRQQSGKWFSECWQNGEKKNGLHGFRSLHFAIKCFKGNCSSNWPDVLLIRGSSTFANSFGYTMIKQN